MKLFEKLLLPGTYIVLLSLQRKLFLQNLFQYHQNLHNHSTKHLLRIHRRNSFQQNGLLEKAKANRRHTRCFRLSRRRRNYGHDSNSHLRSRRKRQLTSRWLECFWSPHDSIGFSISIHFWRCLSFIQTNQPHHPNPRHRRI